MSASENGISRIGDYTFYEFEALPTNEDCFIIDEEYLEEFESELYSILDGGDPHAVGYSNWSVVERVYDETAEITYILDNMRRFHSVDVLLPRAEFVKCIECYNKGVKPRIFVTSKWLHTVLKQQFSVYALIDAIGVKKALREAKLPNEKLLSLRSRIDEIAEKYPYMCFISFADSLLIKRNWQTGFFVEKQKSTYEPEAIFPIIQELKEAYQKELGLNIYAVITQGSNGYDTEAPLHISDSRNHVCLNSLGVPFSELLQIDSSVHKAIKSPEGHQPSELYIDTKFFNSLHFSLDGRENASQGIHSYNEPLTSSESEYVLSSCKLVMDNLQPKLPDWMRE